MKIGAILTQLSSFFPADILLNVFLAIAVDNLSDEDDDEDNDLDDDDDERVKARKAAEAWVFTYSLPSVAKLAEHSP